MNRLLKLIIRRHGLENKSPDDKDIEYFKTNYPDDYLFWVNNVNKESDSKCQQSQLPHISEDKHIIEADKDPDRVYSLSTSESIIRDAVKKLTN